MDADAHAVQTQPNGALSPVQHRDCPLCGQDNNDQLELECSSGTWTVRECATCGFVYLDKLAHADVYAEVADAERRAALQPWMHKLSKLTRKRLNLFGRKSLPIMVEVWAKPGPVLDLACGDGTHLDDMSPAFTPYGVEPQTLLAKAADQRFSIDGGACINASVLDGLTGLPDDGFAAVTARSYLHREAQPLAVLRELNRVLVPGGVAIIKVPNYGSINRQVMGRKWCGFRYPDHLNYFTPKSLKKMGEKAGFTAHYGLTYTLPTSDNMYVVFKKAGGARTCYSSCRGGCST